MSGEYYDTLKNAVIKPASKETAFEKLLIK
jgi:hypothetical protein